MRVLALFLVSGFASLVLETVFRRLLGLFLGNAVTATSLTLAIFLGGLAAGAAIFGRAADRSARPLRMYGRLEVGAGVSGALAVAALAFGREPLLAPVRAAGALGGVVAASIAILLLAAPTIFMGGTLPVLARYRIHPERSVLGPLALLYGINTLGASVGAAVSGFVLFESAGIAETGWIGATLALAAGLAAILLDRGERAAASAAPVRDPSPRGRTEWTIARRLAMTIAAMQGAVSLGYEIVWTRLLVLPLRSYTYSFSLMLCLFLFGLVAGALLLGALESRIGDPLLWLATVQLASGAYVASSVLWLPWLLTPASEGGGLAGLIASAWLRAGPVMLPPTILSGMALPLAVRAFAGSSSRPAGEIGAVYATNTLGSIFGSLLAGSCLLPAIGASRSLAALSAAGALSGAAALWVLDGARPLRWAALAVVVSCAAATTVPGREIAWSFAHAGASRQAVTDLLFYDEGATDTVAVVRRDYGFRDPEAKSMLVNGIAMTATVKPVWRYMSAEGHLPALFAPSPARGLVICVGTGITLGALASHTSVTAIDAVDLSESVLAALPVFEAENRAAYRDPKVRVIHADGRHRLETVETRYDLITLEPPPPIVAGSVHLYTREFYRLCRKRLVPGGVVAQWLPLHAQSLASAKATAATFAEAFPYAQLWLPSVRDAVLIGSDRPLTLPPDRLSAAYREPASRESLESAYFESPEALAGTFLLDRAGIVRWSEGATIVTDDRPSIEFFKRYGATMSDAEIATLLAIPRGRIEDIVPGDAAFAVRAESERDAHELYVRSTIAKDPVGSRRAAIASHATRFGRYLLGCDAPQLDALRLESSDGTAWTRQTAYCRDVFRAP